MLGLDDAIFERRVILADGTQTRARLTLSSIEWFSETGNEMREVETLVIVGGRPTIGTGLLQHHELRINYFTGEVVISTTG